MPRTDPRKNPGRIPTLDPQDERSVDLTVHISPRVETLIEDQADGAALGWWVWLAITEKLERDTGYVDVRRQAPRKANRNPRAKQQREAGQEP